MSTIKSLNRYKKPGYGRRTVQALRMSLRYTKGNLGRPADLQALPGKVVSHLRTYYIAS
jgi:hypothetical protein